MLIEESEVSFSAIPIADTLQGGSKGNSKTASQKRRIDVEETEEQIARSALAANHRRRRINPRM
jgi:hypothetical protein